MLNFTVADHSTTILEMERELSSNGAGLLGDIFQGRNLPRSEGQRMKCLMPSTPDYQTPFGFGESQITSGEAAYACQNSQNQPKQAALQAIHNDGQHMKCYIPSTPDCWTTYGFDDSQIPGGEAAYAYQNCQNQPKQSALQAFHNDVGHSWKENSTTRCLSEEGNILPNGTEPDVCSLKGKSTLDSVTPMTPKERKRLNDQNHRKRKREEVTNLKEDKKNLLETVQRLTQDVRRLAQENAQLKHVQRTCSNYQPKSSLVKRKAMFQLNFNNYKSRKEALNMVFNLPDIDDVHLKVKEGIMKVEGSFDSENLLHNLKRVCPTHLLSKGYAIADPSMPGPSTVANSKVAPKELR